MLEIKHNGEIYKFKFGMGFYRAINKTDSAKNEAGETVYNGFRMAVIGLYDGNAEVLANVLQCASVENLNEEIIDEIIDEYDGDLFEEVTSNFLESNATKKAAQSVLDGIKTALKQEAQNQ